jgi:tetratricopeptide (TPR) repeat protein
MGNIVVSIGVFADSSKVLRRRRTLLTAWGAACTGGAGIAVLLGVTAAEAGAAVVVFVVGVAAALLVTREAGLERDEDLVDLVRLPIGAVGDLDAYDAGAAPESPEALAFIASGAERRYIERDIDHRLGACITDALDSEKTRLIVIAGPSKAGKTRTLFEVTRSVAPEALLVAPRSFESIEALVKPGAIPSRRSGSLVLWLDDLEQFVRVGGRGMHRAVLGALDKRKESVVVLATAGGKGLFVSGDVSGFSVPMQDLLREAEVIQLEPNLSPGEKSRLEPYGPELAERIAQEGIGEFMIAGKDLEDKLRSGSHRYGEPRSPHGQAVANAVIDWHRSGILDPIPGDVLRDAYGYYLPPHAEPSEAEFAAGLEWAREPLYSTVALIRSQNGGFRAYDHIVNFVENSLHREIDVRAWQRYEDAASPEQAVEMANIAYLRAYGDPADEWHPLAQEALEYAIGSDDPEVVTVAEFYRAIILADRGEFEGDPRGTVRRAERSGFDHAAIQIAGRLLEAGEETQAKRILVDRSKANNPVASLALGALLHGRGDHDAAMEEFRRADRDDFVDVLPYVRMLLGGRLKIRAQAEAAFREAQAAGCGLAGITLGHMHDLSGDTDAALDTLRRTAEDNRDFVAAMKLVGKLSALGLEEESEEALALAREIREEQMRQEGEDHSPR